MQLVTGGAASGAVMSFGYATDRWLITIAVVLACDRDVRTLPAWAHEAGLSSGVIAARCRAVGVTAKASLDFTRLLRLIINSGGRPPRAFEVLDVVDTRTMQRLLSTGGMGTVASPRWPSVADYLDHQGFIRAPQLLQSVASLCDTCRSGPVTSTTSKRITHSDA